MAAAPEDGTATGLEPFTPSAFLDLPPPTPCGGDGDDPALPDDLVLPYISRMLMEEDIHDKFFYQYPDHPALLQAQQPFADILSGAAADMDFSLDAATTTTSSSSGTGSSFTLSPSSSDVPSFANATWPYDPLELTQLLTAGDANVNTSSLPTGDDGVVQSQQQQSAVDQDSQRSGTTTNTTMPAAHDASMLFSSSNSVDMDMLNQAFLKGMEETNKFLPANTMMETSMEGANKKNKKNKAVEDLEGETGRKSKLMVPEPEETGDAVDKIVTNGYALCLNEMKSLSIAMAKKKKDNNGARKGRNEEAVDLHTLLIHCAQAVSMGDHLSATQLLAQIKQHSSPTGDASQRLAHCFAEGLQARLAGTGSELYRSLMAKRTPVVEFLKAYVLYLAVSCFHMTAYGFSNMTIGKAIAAGKKKKKKKRLHIVDYGVRYGCQWPNLLHHLAKLEGGPPEVRMTCIDAPQPGFRPIAQIEETGHRLSDFARWCGLPSFSFHGIAAKWETVCADDLDIDADEVLVVNNISSFGNLMDEGVGGVDSPSPRDMVLRNIKKMRPDVFTLCHVYMGCR